VGGGARERGSAPVGTVVTHPKASFGCHGPGRSQRRRASLSVTGRYSGRAVFVKIYLWYDAHL